MTLERRQKYLPLIYAALTALFIAVLGGTMTDTGPWYQALQKPPWQPPDWLFAPAWTFIYATLVVSFVKAWDGAEERKTRDWLIVLFCLNGALNIFWSIFFFRLQRPDWALYENTLLWLSVLILVIYTWKISRTASYLLFPYLAWVTFAAWLNFIVVKLNAPFQAA